MLIQLSIRDIVLIERLDLAFESGLSVLTGETGAGKSILLDSLSLALGGRGDGGLVRHGEDRGQVTAVFDVGTQHAARKLPRGSQPGGDQVVAGLPEHDTDEFHRLAAEPAQHAEHEAAAGGVVRTGLHAHEAARAEQRVGVVHRAGDR